MAAVTKSAKNTLFIEKQSDIITTYITITQTTICPNISTEVFFPCKRTYWCINNNIYYPNMIEKSP